MAEIRKDIVIHHNDADGYCSAGLISLLNRKLGVEAPIYNVGKYGAEKTISEDIETKLEGSKIETLYILDFSFPNEILVELCEKYAPTRIVYLDHHATSKDMMQKWDNLVREGKVPNNPNCYTLNHNSECGASLTLKHVRYRCKELRNNKAIERIVNLVKDYDLWLHKYKNSLYFVTGVSLDLPNVEIWRKILTSEELWKKYAAMGAGIIKQQKAQAKKILKNPENLSRKTFGDCKVLILNQPAQWINIVSHEIVENSEFEAVISYCIMGLNDVMVSIRTSDSSNFDSGEFMRRYFGGGGHMHAAGGRAESFAEFCRILEKAELDMSIPFKPIES